MEGEWAGSVCMCVLVGWEGSGGAWVGGCKTPEPLMTDRPAADELAVNALITPTKAKWSRTAPSLS